MKTFDQTMFRLLHEAAYFLVLEAEGTIGRRQFDKWRDNWMNDMGRLMIEMLAEQGQVKQDQQAQKGDQHE